MEEAGALAALPGARISTLAGRDHEAMLGAPDTLASEVVTRFLAKHS
jgi:hypothetical protein